MRGLSVMSKRDEYLANAADCHRKATASPNEDDKCNWLRLAQSWLGLIETSERAQIERAKGTGQEKSS
jgi:hypothetical protein